jgi:thymidylate synthase
MNSERRIMINMEAKRPVDLYMGVLAMFKVRSQLTGSTGNPTMDQTLNHILEVSPRGQKTYESLNFVGIVHEPSATPIETLSPERNEKIARYTAHEFELYRSGTREAEEFAKAAPFWRSIANPDGTVNSAYGYLIWKNFSCGRQWTHESGITFKAMNPWAWALRSLQEDKDTRQAFLRFSLPEHQWFGNRDQVCTMHGQFMIREDQLHFTIVMRSNDIVKGLVYDMPWFCSLMEMMRDDLLPLYPNLTIGSYTHIAHSLHMYERDLPLVYEMLGETYAVPS